MTTKHEWDGSNFTDVDRWRLNAVCYMAAFIIGMQFGDLLGKIL